MKPRIQVNSIFENAFDYEINKLLGVDNHNDDFPKLTQILKWGPNDGAEGNIYWILYEELIKTN